MHEQIIKQGDSIICKGLKVTVKSVVDQFWHNGNVSLEFYDTLGNYRSYKSEFDGGKIIYAGK